MKFEGTIKNKSQIELVGAKQMAKCEFTLERQNGEYPSSIRITVLWDKTEWFKNDYKTGDTATVEANFNAKEYNGRMYNNVTLRAIKKHDNSLPTVSDVVDDLPF